MSGEFLQDEAEFARFCEILREARVTSFLEVGSKYGHSLRRAALEVAPGGRIVSVDLPRGTKAWRESEPALKATIEWLKAQGYDAHLLWADSQNPKTVEQVAALGPFDAIFLDADHRLPGVTLDWASYSPMATKLFAFHDIGWRRAPTWEGTRIDVPILWDRIKRDYEYEEIRLCATGKNNGIGVLFVNQQVAR